MKSTLKLALLATVLMATPVLAHDTNDMDNTTTAKKFNSQRVEVDADGKPVHHKHWRHHKKADADMDTRNNPRGWRDDNGNWHDANTGMQRNARGERVYNDYGNRTADGRWMGMDFNSRHMTDGGDNDLNNRGRHAFIFGDNINRVVKH